MVRTLGALGAAAGADTVTMALPLTPSLVATIVATPPLTAVTLPVPLTVATDGSTMVQVIARPVNATPLASRGIATRLATAPMFSSSVDGSRLTVATGGTLNTDTPTTALFTSL